MAIKKYQLMNNSQTWQQSLKNKEVTKNNFRATKDIKKAKAFVNAIANFNFCFEFESKKELVIFSSDLLEIPLSPAFTFSMF